MWDSTTQESVRIRWTDLLLALVRVYPGKRTKMWSRIPDMMVSSARQTSRLDRWYTMTLRALAIEGQGSAASCSSLCSIWSGIRHDLQSRGADAEDGERRALRLLRDDIATITALAQVRWDEIKAASKAAKETVDGSCC